MKKNVNIVTEYDGNKVIIISDIRFKGKTREEWEEVEEYLKEYIGDRKSTRLNSSHA